MKTSFSLVSAFVMSLAFICTAQARPQTQPPPDFLTQIDSDGAAGFKFTLTNRSAKALTACSINFFVSSETKAQGGMAWDALIQNAPALKPGENLSFPSPHRVGGPYPDRIEVNAGVWEDGETFGDAERVKSILERRASQRQDLTQATALLQQGLDQNWTYDEFLETIKKMPRGTDVFGLETNFEANSRLRQDQAHLPVLVHRLLDRLKQKSEAFEQAKPASPHSP